jgi:cell division protein FtsW
VNFLRQYFKGDKFIWLIVGALSLIGILAVYSSIGAIAYAKHSGNTTAYIMKHVGLLLVGIFMMWLTHGIDFRYLRKPSRYLIYFAIALLVYTFFFGIEINNAVRWVRIPGLGMTFQPSDLAKIALIMYIARFLSSKQQNIGNFKKTFLPVMAHIILVCSLIAPSDLSTAAVLFATSVLLLFIGRIPMKYLMALTATGAVCLTLMVAVILNSNYEGRVQTWKSRIENYIDFRKGGDEVESYQNQQANIAIASGGIKGRGIGKSTQRNFLPSPYADFIFAIIIEEYGLIGALVIIFLYLVLLIRTVKIIIRTPKAFGALLAVGLSFSIAIQAFINMGVAVHLLPNTGLPLPLVSMGGTSLFFTSIAFGIILSLSRKDDKQLNDAES